MKAIRRRPSATRCGIFYTPASGIWQTVWLEPTPATSISDVDLRPDLASDTIRIRVATRGDTTGHTVRAEALAGATVVGTATGGFTEFAVPVPDARRWSPDDPYLYHLRVTLRDRNGRAVDRTTHYFGMREIGVRTIDGVPRPTLNGEFVFQLGTLDQGCSFESVNFPGQYLRHANSRVRNSPDDGTALLRADATWCARRGLTGSDVSLESFNYPGSFLRHFAAEIWLSDGAGGPSWNSPTSWAADVTWDVDPAWAP
ncbi:AbfB domain-containing protein [Solwaraspora sp. WMMD937]|uniref:AbfB domain-containing protein n=1 Tax=Solwaraspora sp. WMMD937 TaxID=3016090 RepID=UPI00249AC72D|nr:AbfB domain-containing protein [Solwaraspora sp. WMMD937]WFE20767.1 AbfB domain-containing protein [Solwaraspora sp. WMMD937]